MSKRVIVTGGTGFIGQPLCRALAAEGYEVVVLTRSPEKADATFSDSRIRGVRWNAKDAGGWGHLADGAFAIVNLAGESLGQRWNAEVKRRILESRVNAGHAVLEAIGQAAQKPEVLVQASAVGYYGPRQDDAALSEEAPRGSDFQAEVCKHWEASTEPAEAMGVRRVVLRMGVVVAESGNGENPLIGTLKVPLVLLKVIDADFGGAMGPLLPVFRLGLGGPIGSGQQWWAWVHRDDAVRATIWLMENPQAHGAYNITAPNPLRNRDFVRELGRALNRPALLPVPGFAMDLLMGEGSSFILKGQRAVPTKLIEQGFTFDYPTAFEAFKAL